MVSLDLFKERGFTMVKLSDGKEYKIPDEYTVEELERILEKQSQIKNLSEQEVEGDGVKQLQGMWGLVFAELEILFQHYHPDITSADLRGIISHNDALRIIDFHNLYRPDKKTDPDPNPKKKVLSEHSPTSDES